MTEPPAPTGKRILIAEDSEDISLIIASLLESHGHEVVKVDNADAVLPAMVREQPDLLVLDVMMPSDEGLDGFAICQEVKHGKLAHLDVPVIMLSAIAQDLGKSEDQMKSGSGADAFIHKPFDVSHLLETIEALLSR